MARSNLAAMLRVAESQLKLALDNSRASHEHAGLRGDAVERAVRELLDRHLPRYLSVGTGEVIDLKDTRSNQTDVVIANEDQPLRFDRDEPGIYLVEGVAAVGEVKSRLTTRELQKTLASGARFKSLRIQFQKGDTVQTNESDQERFYRCPPNFLVAIENDVSIQTLLDRLAAAPPVSAADGSGPPLPALDAVFVLGQGLAINYGDGQGSVAFNLFDGSPPTPRRAAGWVWQSTSDVLVSLMFWLNAVMPRVLRFSSVAAQYLHQSRSAAGEVIDVVLPSISTHA